MKRVIAIMLAFMMCIAVMPVSSMAVSSDKALSTKLFEESIIEVNEQDNNNAGLTNAVDITNASKTKLKSADICYTAEELSSFASEGIDKFIEKTSGLLPDEYFVSDEYTEQSEKMQSLKDPAESENSTIRAIAECKEKSEQRMKDAIEYGEKLMNTKSNEKYIVIDDVILITNEDELRGIAGQSGYFRLACDINLTTPWEPVDFYGTLEGGGHIISGAVMQYVDVENEVFYDDVGFFSLIGEGAIVKNLTLNNPYVYANAEAGSLCAVNMGTIDNCHVEGGQVVSYLWADYENPFWQYSGYNMGGLVGLNQGYIMNSSFVGDVDGWFACGGICGVNAGIVWASYANGNVCNELNNWDVDLYGASYYQSYGYSYYPTFTTMLRLQWAAFMLGEYEATAFGYNGGLTGQNYGYIWDCAVQGSGNGNTYSLGVVAGLDSVGGIVGADIGWVSHCYVIDKAFPVLADGAELYYPWEYGDEGYGIYYDYDYFLIHKGIAYVLDESETKEGDEIYYYGSAGLPCNDGMYHGEALTEEQFYNPDTFKNWNKGEWNQGDVWILTEGAIPIISDVAVIPSEYVIHYKVGNSGGLLEGEFDVYKIAKYDEATGIYAEPVPPKPTGLQQGYGIAYWTSDNPYMGKKVYSDITYTAFFGKVPSNLMGDTNLDRSVDTADVVYLLKSLSNNTVESFTYQQRINTDVNYDGYANTGDAVNILKYCAGIIDKF